MYYYTMISDDLLQGLTPSKDPIAVIVFHGIGQQAPFETLNGVVEAFIDAHVRDRDGCWKLLEKRPAKMDHASLDGTVSFVAFIGHPNALLPLAEIDLQRKSDGATQAFHFYEMYWAPMTEGVVRFTDVVVFLLKAAWDGVLAQLRDRHFSRYTFREEQDYGILTMTGIQLFFAFFVVAGLVILAATFFAILAADVLNQFQFPLAKHLPIEPLRTLLVSFAFSTPLLALFAIVNAYVQKRTGSSTKSTLAWVNFASIVPLIGGIGWFGVLCVYTLLTFRRGWGAWWQDKWLDFIPAGIRWVIFCGVGIYLFTQFYRFLVKSVGDVTAYVSAHAVNRFWQVRQAIQDLALDIGRSVYTRKKRHAGNNLHPLNTDPMYKDVVIVAHSLGSVIAYDMLNTLINFELEKCADDLKNIASRTRLFLTCGSPLNKIAFLFRFQAGRGPIPRWRELLNNYRQPLIVEHDADHRPKRWINISCFPDWISGQLKYYEPAEGRKTKPLDAQEAFARYRINERRDPDGIIPLAAHTQYFKNKVFRTAIYEALWEGFREPRDVTSGSSTSRHTLEERQCMRNADR